MGLLSWGPFLKLTFCFPSWNPDCVFPRRIFNTPWWGFLIHYTKCFLLLPLVPSWATGVKNLELVLVLCLGQFQPHKHNLSLECPNYQGSIWLSYLGPMHRVNLVHHNASLGRPLFASWLFLSSSAGIAEVLDLKGLREVINRQDTYQEGQKLMTFCFSCC
jgi:hypothetical protein